jgi:hypothetical protein
MTVGLLSNCESAARAHMRAGERLLALAIGCRPVGLTREGSIAGSVAEHRPSILMSATHVVTEFRITPFPPRESSASGGRLPPTGRTRAVT